MKLSVRLLHLFAAACVGLSTGIALAGPVTAEDAGAPPVVALPADLERPVTAHSSDRGAAVAAEARRIVGRQDDEFAGSANRAIDPALVAGRPREFDLRSSGRPAAVAEPDPLREVARSLVNVGKAPEAAEPSAPRGNARVTANSERNTFSIDLDEDVRATVLDVKTAVADAARAVLDPKINEDGRVTVSLAGIDGFQLSANGKELAVGYGNTTLGSVGYGGASAGGAPGNGSSRRAAAEEADLVASLVNQVVKILDHPLTWLCIALGLMGWLFAVVMSSLAKRNAR